jgi:molybdenum cofactor synthesis domain-containing protein
MELNLLKKTELRITNLSLENVNLSKVAQAVASELGLPEAKVLVIDVREDHICLDLLEKTLDLHQIVGKEQAIIDRLKAIAGLTVSADTKVESAGIMGLIGVDCVDAGALAATSAAMVTEIENNVLSRALVYATGFEVERGMIEDTNSPYLIKMLAELGYRAEFGGVIPDSLAAIRRKLDDAADRGFGLVITTGGVGAEDKDFSVEALTALDRDAHTPWLVQFIKGEGRHVKAGVRIGVGQTGLTTYLSLPGPHDEVVAASKALIEYCKSGQRIDKAGLANGVAHILREKLRGKQWYHGHYHHRHH